MTKLRVGDRVSCDAYKGTVIYVSNKTAGIKRDDDRRGRLANTLGDSNWMSYRIGKHWMSDAYTGEPLTINRDDSLF